MDTQVEKHRIADIATLEALYGLPAGASVKKEVAYIHPHYRTLIAASPFAVLATSGPEGVDTSRAAMRPDLSSSKTKRRC